MLTEEQVAQFQGLYKKRFSKEINREKAYEQGTKLVRLVELIYKPMTDNEYGTLQQRRPVQEGLIDGRF